MDAESRFRVIFERAYPALHGYARRRGLSWTDADDLVAATLEVAWRRLDDVPADDPLPWLYGVARNVARNQRRSQRRQDKLLRELRAAEAQPGPGEAGQTDPGALRRAFGELSEADQEILRLIAWEGLTPVQLAGALGCSPIAARSRLHRARRRLAARLNIQQETQRSGSAGQIPGDAADRVAVSEVCDG